MSPSLSCLLLCFTPHISLNHFYHHFNLRALDAAKRNLSALAHQFARNKANDDSADRSKLINDEEAVSQRNFTRCHSQFQPTVRASENTYAYFLDHFLLLLLPFLLYAYIFFSSSSRTILSDTMIDEETMKLLTSSTPYLALTLTGTGIWIWTGAASRLHNATSRH